LLDPEKLHLLETFAGQFALAIERAFFAQEAEQALVQAETERMRNAILSSVSHDLRTPLATITGAASSLLEGGETIGTESSRELVRAIYNEANRLEVQVRNLLDMTRIESGAVRLQKEWHPLEEVVGAALTRMEGRLRARPIRTRFPPDLPLVRIDGVLIEQVLINLLENALKYTPPDSPIDLSASVAEKGIVFEIADYGPGLPPGEEKKIFEKFYRAGPQQEGGVGLGLAICRGIIEAHGGRIWAQNRPNGGAAFRFILPLEGDPPGLVPEKVGPDGADSWNGPSGRSSRVRRRLWRRLWWPEKKFRKRPEWDVPRLGLWVRYFDRLKEKDGFPDSNGVAASQEPFFDLEVVYEYPVGAPHVGEKNVSHLVDDSSVLFGYGPPSEVNFGARVPSDPDRETGQGVFFPDVFSVGYDQPRWGRLTRALEFGA
jgi:nitrogen-specific signal transduction histidine kinase